MCKRSAPHLSEYTGSCFAKALLLTCQKTREAVFKRTAPHLSEYTGSWFHKDYSSLMLGSKGSSHNRSVAWTGLESDWHHMFLTSWCFQSPQISYSSNCGLIFLRFNKMPVLVIIHQVPPIPPEPIPICYLPENTCTNTILCFWLLLSIYALFVTSAVDVFKVHRFHIVANVG